MDPKSLPAFPFPDAQGPAPGAETGMTLRDYFAAKALPATLAEYYADVRVGSTRFDFAKAAYAAADAMLNARNA